MEGPETVDSLTSTNVGWPAFTLASTMNLPIYPVPPMDRIDAISETRSVQFRRVCLLLLLLLNEMIPASCIGSV